VSGLTSLKHRSALIGEGNEFLILSSLFEDLPTFSPESIDFLL
jgi:hypothetical protein